MKASSAQLPRIPRLAACCASVGILLAVAVQSSAGDFPASAERLFKTACVDCHDGSDEARIDLRSLKSDLKEDASFRSWERIYDRVTKGEMPPKSEERPDPKIASLAMRDLKQSLKQRVLKEQAANGRVILRRLTRVEFGYTMQDLFGFDRDLSSMIPAENASTSFDTVFNNQGFSPLHIKSFLAAANAGLSTAIELGRKPKTKKQRFLYKEQEGVRKHFAEKNEQETVLETDDAIVMFNNAAYIFKVHGLELEHHGRYRIRAKVAAYQATRPVILTLNAGDYKKGSQRTLGFFDIKPGEAQVIELDTTLEEREYLFPGAERLHRAEDGKDIWNIGANDYKGEGIAIEWIEVEGPLVDSWPPPRTAEFLTGIKIRERDQVGWDGKRHVQFELVAGDDPKKQIEDVVQKLAPRAFRRPLKPRELDQFVALGHDALVAKRPIEDAVRIACRGVLNSPEFLLMTSDPGPLDEFELAERLSYFLWKSMPDATLFRLARDRKLTNPKVLRQQVERMLQDRKSRRFVDDFVDQWLRLVDVDATVPDKKLYPEFDELLKQSMLEETRGFVAHLVEKDLSTDCLIDSDFAMLNRRLAEHYEIPGVEGQHSRVVPLPNDSIRGGILTHGSILKITANGTVTTPVRRGSWVLTHLLGQPPDPPPPGIGSIEPDTRGATTIRETLAKHRNDESCAACHLKIDPPGFALESFDVIGGYRDRYRSVGEGEHVKQKLLGRNIWEYKHGLAVDASGQTAAGEAFNNFEGFKALLMKEREQVARNVISQLLVYSTGAEIQFADRDDVEAILKTCRADDFGFRTIIHEVVQSRLFRNK